MADPVSWLLIRPGWRVEAADGSEVGRVEEVTGDSSVDIFNGLAIAFSVTGKQHYVPAEQVGEITEGVVRLTIDRTVVEQLPEFEEPAEELQIEPDKASRTERVEEWALQPESKPHQTGLFRRIAEWLGLTGR